MTMTMMMPPPLYTSLHVSRLGGVVQPPQYAVEGPGAHAGDGGDAVPAATCMHGVTNICKYRMRFIITGLFVFLVVSHHARA